MGKLHHNKEIAAAIQEALEQGWTFKKSSGSAHAFGVLLCPEHNRLGCKKSVLSTPRNPENHAKQIRKAIKQYSHSENNE
ncbi:hypothetical protein [Picosynechococcus sp. NKBG042902]|uniref:hypothetical protein n=1 Tax=Picosynechococcus sp. NKBG042902 TaxID=490193 RepID=UPI0004AA44E8|nr:hypothetical protein [Picosynechococcus sp. NKBG042902]